MGRLCDGFVRHHQAFKGIEIYKSNSDPSSPDYTGVECTTAMRFVGGGNNLRIEDCRSRFMEITIQSFGSVVYNNVSFRRNVVLDAWKANSFNDGNKKISGLFVSGVVGYTIEENLFDHNGWNEAVANAGANQFSHNVYVQYNNSEGGMMRGNIFARGAAAGLQARSGGVIDRNLFVLNSVALNIGLLQSPTDPDVVNFANEAVDNVVLNGRLMSTVNSSYPRSSAVWGVQGTQYIPNALVDGNIVANRVHSGSNISYVGTQYMIWGFNISYNWDPNQDTFNASWPHPNDDLGDYNASIAGTNSTDAYLTTLRNRAVGELPWNLTAYAAINYLRAGFLMSPISGVYQYPGGGGGGTPVASITASDASAGEPANHGQFTVTLSPAPAAPVVVNLTRTGTATNGTDYNNIPTTATVGTSGTSLINVTVIDDATTESSESVILTLASGSGYIIGSPSSATVTIADNDASTTTVTFTGVAADDGWVLESGEFTNVGGTLDATGGGAAALRVGDAVGDKQYKAIASFDTASLPDGATIISAELRLRRGQLLGTNPFTTHGTCRVDIKGGTGFGGSTTLAAGDFQTAADAAQVATMSNPTSNGAWSTGLLNATGRSFVNKTGRTQFRAYFTTDDNDDNGNDYTGFHGGNDPTAGNRPQLVITYQ